MYNFHLKGLVDFLFLCYYLQKKAVLHGSLNASAHIGCTAFAYTHTCALGFLISIDNFTIKMITPTLRTWWWSVSKLSGHI